MERKFNKQPKLHLKKNDMVQVITGANKGARGRILRVILADRKAVVEGVNLKTKHTKPTAQNPNGGIIKVEAPIHISNLVYLHNGEPTKIGRKADDKGKLVRYAKKTGEVIA